MKLNFRKIASVLSSAVMVSSTVALAAAASTYPAPFVTNGTADVAVVWGSTATLDSAAVTDLVANLNSKVTTTTDTTTTVTGESFTLQKARDKFNLNNDLNDIYPSLDKDELPILLADGTYDADDEQDYSQDITLGSAAMSHFQNDDFNDEKPIIGFALATGDMILNYTLTFDSPIAMESDTDLTIMGKKYYIAENTSNTVTLLDASQSQRINEGETLQVEGTNGKTYSVKLDYVEEETSDADEPDVNFIINDEAIDAMEPGDTEEVEEGVYIVVDKADYIDSDTRTSYAQFSLGTGKLYLQDGGEEVELNDDPISSIDAYDQHEVTSDLIYGADNNLKTIVLTWNAADDLWMAPGTDLVMPGFDSVKLSMGEFQHGDYEETSLKGSGDAYWLDTEILDGAVSIPLLYHSSGTVAGLGKDSNEILVTNATGGTLVLNQSLKPYFVTTWSDGSDEGETHAFKLKKVDNNSDDEMEVTLDDLAAGKDDVVITGIGESVTIGEVEITLTNAVDTTSIATLTISASGSGSVYTDRVITKNGLEVFLPVYAAADAAGIVSPYVNRSNIAGASSWKAVFKEEDKDDTIAGGRGFNVSLAVSDTDGFEPGSYSTLQGVTLYETEDNSDQYIGYVESELATKIEMDVPSSGVNTIKISYPDSESYSEVIIAESGATISGGETGNLVPIFDTDTIPTDKNLLVVGGSCVNAEAARLLSVPANSCGNAWQTATGVGNGQFLIQTFARDGGKVATLVAGYTVDDTANAVKALKTDTTIDVSAGKKYVGTATSVQAVNVA